mgnify:CR=1 FL=1
MPYDPQKHRRRSIRLKGYDYSQAGAYFITICINHGECRLGNNQNGVMVPSPAGEMVIECWFALHDRFPAINLDAFGLMPNHLHGILFNTKTDYNRQNNPILLGNVLGALKSISTNQYIKGVKEHNWEPFDKRLWQRNYYEHIIRNERSLNAIRIYINDNPVNWHEDKLHPDAPSNTFNKSWKRPSIPPNP